MVERSFKNQEKNDSSYYLIEETIAGKMVYLIFLETFDGLYTTIGLRLPPGNGPHPLVLLASGNGGEGMGWIKENMERNSYTLDLIVEAGYACAWVRYRTEVELGYNEGGKLIRDKRQGRELFNRSPLEYEDQIAVIEGLKKFKEIDPSKIGLIGMSHGGEMVLKILSEYGGVSAAVASEPASHEFLCLTPDASAFVNHQTKLRNIESMQMQEVDKVKALIDTKTAMTRIKTIKTPIFVMGRNADELQGIFRLTFELLKDSSKDVIWKTYEHDLHGFIFPEKNEKGCYIVDSVQKSAIKDIILFLSKYLKN